MNTVFFDLDGTLTDPKQGITRSIRYALEKLEYPCPLEDDLTWCIGPPLHSSFLKLVGNEKDALKALAYYRERFAKTGLYENILYPGIKQMLLEIRKAGFGIHVATSKPTVYALPILEHFGLKDKFERIFGSELDGTRVDKTRLLCHALEETGTRADEAIMVGDRSHDVIGARNNNMTAIGVLYGYGSPSELTAAGAHHLCKTPKDVFNLASKLYG